MLYIILHFDSKSPSVVPVMTTTFWPRLQFLPIIAPALWWEKCQILVPSPMIAPGSMMAEGWYINVEMGKWTSVEVIWLNTNILSIYDIWSTLYVQHLANDFPMGMPWQLKIWKSKFSIKHKSIFPLELVSVFLIASRFLSNHLSLFAHLKVLLHMIPSAIAPGIWNLDNKKNRHRCSSI